jgi:hypothetical protein
MKVNWGSGGIATRILDFGTRWRSVDSLMPTPLYPQGRSPWCPLDKRLCRPHPCEKIYYYSIIPSTSWSSNALLTPWCRILFEKLVVTQLVKKYPFSNNISFRRFISSKSIKSKVVPVLN